MIHSVRTHIIIGLLVLLFASCGQQHKSQSLVDDFMQSNMIAPDEMDEVEYSKLDSTKLITDSIVQALRRNAKDSRIFRPDTKYFNGTVGRKLFRLRISYKQGGSDQTATFYMDEGLNGVVAVKKD